MESIVIYRLLDIQQHWPLHVSVIIISALHIPSTIIQHLPKQLFKISAQDRMLFANAVEQLDKKLMPASSVVQNSSHQVLEEIRISSTPFMAMKQMNHQESGASKLQKLTSNPVPLLPTPALRFQLSWGELTIIPFIMVMLKFTLQIFKMNLTPNQFQIQTPLQLNQSIIMKCIISCNYYINNRMKILWMLNSICFKLDWWFSKGYIWTSWTLWIFWPSRPFLDITIIDYFFDYIQI